MGNNAVAAHIAHLRTGLARVVDGSDTSVNHDVAGLDAGGVTASVGLVDHGAIGTDRD